MGAGQRPETALVYLISRLHGQPLHYWSDDNLVLHKVEHVGDEWSFLVSGKLFARAQSLTSLLDKVAEEYVARFVSVS